MNNSALNLRPAVARPATARAHWTAMQARRPGLLIEHTGMSLAAPWVLRDPSAVWQWLSVLNGEAAD